MIKYLIFLSLLLSCGHPLKSKKDAFNAPFDGERFYNLEPFEKKGFFSLLKWRIFGSREPWPEWVESTYKQKPPERNTKGIRFSVINHATVLIQVDGINILTDPIYSERASPFSSFGPKRVRNPGLSFDQLPPIDLVLISHNHYDHMDLPTLKKLNERDKPLFMVGLGNKETLNTEGIHNVLEMDWWQEERNVLKSSISINFVPAQHWSARGLFDRFETLWGGFFIQTKSGNIYFAGDTGFGEFFKRIKARYGSPILSFFPIGAYEPRWFMKAAHMNPQEAIKAHFEIESTHSYGIHFGTFQLTDEGYKDPIEDFMRSKKNVDFKESTFEVPEFGKGYFVSLPSSLEKSPKSE